MPFVIFIKCSTWCLVSRKTHVSQTLNQIQRKKGLNSEQGEDILLSHCLFWSFYIFVLSNLTWEELKSNLILSLWSSRACGHPLSFWLEELMMFTYHRASNQQRLQSDSTSLRRPRPTFRLRRKSWVLAVRGGFYPVKHQINKGVYQANW